MGGRGPYEISVALFAPNQEKKGVQGKVLQCKGKGGWRWGSRKKTRILLKRISEKNLACSASLVGGRNWVGGTNRPRVDSSTKQKSLRAR